MLNDRTIVINNSFIFILVVWKIVIPEYVMDICTMMINSIINKKILFSDKWANIFSLCVLALNALNVAKKINRQKNDVIKWLLSTNKLFIIGSFRKIMHSTKEYNPEDSISLIIYLFKMFSSFFFGCSFMYSIRGTS